MAHVTRREVSTSSPGKAAEGFVGLWLVVYLALGAAAQTHSIDPALLAKAKAGDANAEERLSISYSRLGNEKESCRWGRVGAQNGNEEAQAVLGLMYEEGSAVCGLPKDDTQAAIWFRKAAEQGDVISQGELASVYDSGKDFSQAAIWRRKAAEQGEADAQYDLGLLYYNGQGVPQDYAQAAAWFRNAAELRPGESAEAPELSRRIRQKTTANAQLMLGRLYCMGQGVAQSYKEAAVWYRRSAELGNEEAQMSLGNLYEVGGIFTAVASRDGSQKVARDDGGREFPIDDAQAVFWYRKAAEQGNYLAQDSLANLYRNGSGVPQDYAEAYFWSSLAAAKYEGFRKIATMRLPTSPIRCYCKRRNEHGSGLKTILLK